MESSSEVQKQLREIKEQPAHGVLHSPKWDKIRAMQVEWLCRFPTRRKPRPRQFAGPIGRIKSLTTIFTSLPAAEKEHLTLYLHADFFELANSYNISDHVHLRMLEDLPTPPSSTPRQKRKPPS
eukprot:gene28524-37479_t